LSWDDIAHYCIIRRDLPLGTISAQLVHAAGESIPGNLPSCTIAIVLAAKNEQHLLDIEQRLIKKGIPHKSIREPDPPWHNSIMAIGVYPDSKKKLRKHFSNLPLLR